MSRAFLILAFALGIALSAAAAEDGRDKSGSSPSPKTAASETSAAPVPVPDAVASPSQGAALSGSQDRGEMEEKIRRYAEALLKQFDKNKNGVLDKEEWSQMPSRSRGADRNADGIITLDELSSRLLRPEASARQRRGTQPTSPSSPEAVRPLPPVNPGTAPRMGGETPRSPGNYIPVPAAPALVPPMPSTSLPAQPHAPIDLRAPLVSVQLVLLEVVSEAAKAVPEAKPPASPEMAKGLPTVNVDLSASNERIVEELRKLGLRGRLDVFYRVQLTAAAGQIASFHLGQREPRVVGVMANQFGQSNTIDLMNTGLRLEIRPLTSGSNVGLTVNLEESRLGRADEGIPVSVSAKGEATVRSAPVHTRILQTSVNVASGQTIVLSGLTKEDGPHKRQLVVLACARVVPVAQGETTRPVR